ncbi:MAG TPA: FtsX-like permease family protein [Elusimicrobiales bacterium]|nr:FtsX-like permease family protein [Elusimicrobiales bacterium]
MLMIKMAFRNLLRHKRRSLFTGLTILGGFVLSSLSFGIAEGTYDAIINAFTKSSTGDVQLHKKGYLDSPSIYKTLNNPEKLEAEIIKLPQISSVAPRVYFPSLIFLKNKTTAGQIIGINPIKEKKTTTIENQILRGNFLSNKALNEVMLSSTMVKILNADVGKEISLVTQAADGSMANDNFKIKAILKDSTENSKNIFMHIKSSQEFLYLGTRIHELAVTLTDSGKARKSADLINLLIEDKSVKAEPWQVVKKDFHRAMKADKKGNTISIIVIMIIVAIGVLNTVLMSVLERTREFGVLKALGTKPFQIFKLIVLETSFLTLASIGIGLIFAIGLNYYFVVYGIKIPQPITYGGIIFDKIISTLEFKIFLIPALITFFTALTVSVFPAIRAAKITPIKAMKDF